MKTAECFFNYEKLMHEKFANLPFRDFSKENTKKEIISLVKKSLRIKEKWIPKLKVEVVKTIKKSSFKVQLLKAETWKGVQGAANLYVPDKASCDNKLPLIIICCGHAENGKLDPTYQTMATILAKQGSVVLVADNIGQGERTAMGHSDCPGVFACGLSVQGLIVMETLGWLRWAAKLNFVNSSQIGASGNSGGGKLCMLLCALFPKLSAACPTGYPCTFDFIARKEKRHCDCNIVLDCLGSFEMWDVLGCFAPKPLLIAQGIHDNLFPEDIFYYTARKIKDIYIQGRAENDFDAISLPGTHSWDLDRQNLIARFFQKVFKLVPPKKILNTDLLSKNDLVFLHWPKKSLTTEQLACVLTHKVLPANCTVEDIFKPRFEPSHIQENNFRSGDTRRIFAQFEAFMS